MNINLDLVTAPIMLLYLASVFKIISLEKNLLDKGIGRITGNNPAKFDRLFLGHPRVFWCSVFLSVV